MGTRARVNVISDGKPLVSIYRQFDGYPSGLGQEVANFAKRFTIVNGIGVGDRKKRIANGMDCFAAQLIKRLKDGVGNVYLRDTSETSYGEEYSYTLSEKNSKIYMTAYAGRMTAFGCPGDTEPEMQNIFDGFAKDFHGEKLEASSRRDLTRM